MRSSVCALAARWRYRPKRIGPGMPNFALERRCKGVVCGIDEAGRGPLAGPVVAAAVILDMETMPRRLRRELDDSKKLSREAREEYFPLIKGCARIGVG